MRSGRHDSLCGVFKAAMKSLATLFHWSEGAATLLQNQLMQAIENTTQEYLLSLAAIVR